MPLESAEFITGLQNAYPSDTDDVNQGDNHIRLIKYVLKSSFPNINGAMTRTAAQLNAAPYDAATLATMLGGKAVTSKGGFNVGGTAMQTPPPEIALGWNAAKSRIHPLVGATALGGLLVDSEFTGAGQSGQSGGISGHQRFPGEFELQWGNASIVHPSTGASKEDQIALPRGFTRPITGWTTWRVAPFNSLVPVFDVQFTQTGFVRIRSNYTVAGTWQLRWFALGLRTA